MEVEGSHCRGPEGAAVCCIQQCYENAGIRRERRIPVSNSTSLETRINWMLRQTEKISNSRRRRLKREEKWSTITVQEDEICQSPGDIVAQRRVREKELEKENELLRSQLNEKAAKLYEEMARARQPPSSLVNLVRNLLSAPSGRQLFT